MKIQTELNNMEKSDLKWICKTLHITCKISDTKQSIIRKLLNPMNKKYNSGSIGQLSNYEEQQKQYDNISKEDSHQRTEDSNKSKEDSHKSKKYDDFLERLKALEAKPQTSQKMQPQTSQKNATKKISENKQ